MSKCDPPTIPRYAINRVGMLHAYVRRLLTSANLLMKPSALGLNQRKSTEEEGYPLNAASQGIA